MVGHMQDTGLFAVVITADKVVVRMIGHVRGRHRDILITGNIHTGGIVLLIVNAGGNGEAGHIALAVVHNSVYIRREHRLGIIVDRHRRVSPPQESLRHGSTVVQLGVDLDVRLIREDGKAGHALGAEHVLDLADNDRAAAIRILADIAVYRIVGAGAVVLRPVELDAAADPGAGQADQRRFDHVVIVNKIVVVGLIISALDAAAQLGQDHHIQIFVFQAEGVVNTVLFFILDLINNAVRVHFAAAALVNAFFQEHGVFVRLADRVRGDGNIFPPDSNAFCNVFHRETSHI